MYVLSTDIDTFFPTEHILSVDSVNYPLVNNSLSTDFSLSTDKHYLLIY